MHGSYSVSLNYLKYSAVHSEYVASDLPLNKIYSR
jgi:hypothetical protein